MLRISPRNDSNLKLFTVIATLSEDEGEAIFCYV
jgi:hypothetical protein